MREVLLSSLTSIVLTVIMSLNYFFILPTNFLVISTTLLILSLVILAWDIYEWRHYEN